MIFFFYPQKTRRKSKVSGKNRVLLLDGDELFKAYLIQRVELEIRQPLELASTSSGIVMDLIEPRKESSRKRTKRLNSVRYSLEEVSHLFLPMISLYRGTTALGDPIADITIAGSRVCFKSLPNGCLIIHIGGINESKRLIEDYKRNLELNLGPLLDVLENEYGSLKQAKENVTATITKQINGERPFNEAIDIRRTVFHRASTQKLLPLVKSICTQLQLFLGNNRCLLLCDKSVLLSTHSAGNDKPLARHLDVKDLQGLISQLASHPIKLKDPEITQAWLRSTRSVVPFYVNVIRYNMANNLTLVCLHTTKADRFIRLVVLILMQIEQLHTTSELERVLSELTESVNELTSHLQGFVTDSKENSDYPFLRNPLRSAQFFKGLWTKLSLDLGKLLEPKTPEKFTKRFSLFSLKSALSSFPLVSSTFSLKNNNGKQTQEIPMKTDVQLALWRKQILSLLNELSNLARKDAATYKLPLFIDSMKRIIKPYTEKLIVEHSKILSEAELKYNLYLRPVDYKLNMLGYCLVDIEKNLELSFETDEIKKDLPNWMYTSPAPTHCLDVIGASTRSYTIYKLSGHKNLSRGSALKSLLNSQPAPLLPPEITVTAVFDGYVHKELASKQIQALVKLIRVHLTDSVHVTTATPTTTITLTTTNADTTTTSTTTSTDSTTSTTSTTTTTTTTTTASCTNCDPAIVMLDPDPDPMNRHSPTSALAFFVSPGVVSPFPSTSWYRMFNVGSDMYPSIYQWNQSSYPLSPTGMDIGQVGAGDPAVSSVVCNEAGEWTFTGPDINGNIVTTAVGSAQCLG